MTKWAGFEFTIERAERVLQPEYVPITVAGDVLPDVVEAAPRRTLTLADLDALIEQVTQSEVERERENDMRPQPKDTLLGRLAK